MSFSRLFLNTALMVTIFACVAPKLSWAFGSSAPAETQNLNPLTVEGVDVTPSKQAKEAGKIHAGDTIEVKVKFKLDEGFHAYLEQYKLKLLSPSEFYLSEFQIQPLIKFTDPISKKTKTGTQDYAEMISLLDIPNSTAAGTQELHLELTYQACGKDFCLFPKTVPVKFAVKIEGESGKLVTDALKKGWWYALLIVFFAGVLTSLTPCIFPMIPITMAVLGVTDKGRSRREGFVISLFYVLGIAITYAILGVIAAKTGALFGSLLGHPVVVGAIAVIFVLMALSMFGLFEITIPAAIAAKISSTRTDKNFLGGFVSGLIAGVVASPCVGPVLISILAYVAQTQDGVVGFILLFVFALGLGQLFLLIGTFNNFLQRLPRSGAWMEKVKIVFGILMLGLAVYYVYPVLPQHIQDTVNPAHWFSKNQTGEEEKPVAAPAWQKYSDAALAQALKDKKPVIIDFKADWCLSCKELELYTFSDAKVLELGRDFVWLAFDATSPSPELAVLQKKYGIGGLPYIVIYDASGKQRPDLTLTGFEKAEPFLARLKQAHPAP